MNKNIMKIKRELRAFAKRCKKIKYTEGLLLSFLMLGFTAFSAETGVKDREIAEIGQSINTSIKDIKVMFKKAKKENNRLLKTSNLELIQLMEQGDHIVKSPWSSWQFGTGFYANSWKGVYKGEGDRQEKYPYEGVYKRSDDMFLRNISPDSKWYKTYTENRSLNDSASSLTSDRKKAGFGDGYGIQKSLIVQEPVVEIELSAGIRPKEIIKSPINITPPVITINSVTPLNQPLSPEKPSIPDIPINSFNPVVPKITPPILAEPPVFNIKLGSYCNTMADPFWCPHGGNSPDKEKDGGQYGFGTADIIGVPKSYFPGVTEQNITDVVEGQSSLRYSWSETGSVLLRSYYDYTGVDGIRGIVTVSTQNLTVDSINPLNAAQREKREK